MHLCSSIPGACSMHPQLYIIIITIILCYSLNLSLLRIWYTAIGCLSHVFYTSSFIRSTYSFASRILTCRWLCTKKIHSSFSFSHQPYRYYTTLYSILTSLFMWFLWKIIYFHIIHVCNVFISSIREIHVLRPNIFIMYGCCGESNRPWHILFYTYCVNLRNL